MGLIKEEDEFRLLRVTYFRQLLKEFREDPEKECCIELRGVYQFFCRQDIDYALAGLVGLDEVVDAERRLSKEFFSSLLVEGQQISLDRPDACGGDVSILDLELLGVFPDKLDHCPEVLQVKEQIAIIVGDLENNAQHPALGVVEVEQAGQKERSHVGYCRADRVPQFTEYVPEDNRIAFETESLRDRASLSVPPPSDGRHRPLAMLARSPLTSAIKTGTPILLNCSASTLRVTVFPVPVAPAISP